MKTILVAVDLSPATVRVCAAAADLARATGGRLVIFHAVPPIPQLMFGIDPFTTTQLEAHGRSSRKAAAHKLEALQRWFKKRGPDTKMALHEGPAADNILKSADRINPDYIVLGSHGHGAMYDLLLGSTAQLVIRKALCPVVLVPISKQTGKSRQKKLVPSFHGVPWSYD